jgi:hypothetical protein
VYVNAVAAATVLALEAVLHGHVRLPLFGPGVDITEATRTFGGRAARAWLDEQAQGRLLKSAVTTVVSPSFCGLSDFDPRLDTVPGANWAVGGRPLSRCCGAYTGGN